MASENEPARLLLPYLQRADELQKHEPLVAYYCRLYAMERGLKIPPSERTKNTNALLISLMKQLEKDKKSLTLAPDDHLHLEGFALNVFAKADKQDRAGRSDLNTAKTFYAASIFFEILNQFGEPQPDLEQKQKYSAWKAADIRKALKEGRKPIPGPPDVDNDPSDPSNDLDSNWRNSTDEPDLSNINLNSKTAPDFHSSSPQDDSIPQQPSNLSPHPPHDSTNEYTSADFQSPRSNNEPDHPYPQRYHPYQSPQEHFPPHYPPETPPHLPQHYPSEPPAQLPQHYPSEPPAQLPQHYPSHDNTSYSYPNFQSYPSFTDTSLPTTPSHTPYYQGSDLQKSSSFSSYPSNVQFTGSAKRGSAPEIPPSTAHIYQYDSNYQAPPEKIAEAHKAARFAVGALAFDDVPTAIEHLKNSLELLTNPSAGGH